MGKLLGLYSGQVELVAGDSLKLGRIKARCPAVHGPADHPTNSIATSNLPWAFPQGLPAGGSSDSGMVAWLPQKGDPVNIQFLDGEPEKPVWTWGGQSTAQALAAGVWTRQPGGYGSDGSAPQSALLTRYGHSVDFQPDFIMLRSASGYKLRFVESAQRVDLFAPNGKILIGNLIVGGTDMQLNPGNSLGVNTTNFTVSAADSAVINAITSILSASATAQVAAPIVQLGPNDMATDPVVRLSDFAAVVSLLVTWLNTHVHIAVSLGHPTTPPVTPIVLAPTGSSTTFTA